MYGRDRPFRRVLVALDAGPDYYGHLQRGAGLAQALGAELSVLFIEDDALFRLCGLSTVEIAFASRALRPMESRTLERELRARAAEARASVERIARVAELAWSFQVWRGRTDEALREAARHADLVSLSRALKPMAARRFRGVHAPATRIAPVPVIAFHEAGGDAATARRVLDVAGRVASSLAAPLTVVAIGGSGRGQARREAEARLADIGVEAQWRSIQPSKRSILRLLQRLPARLLVLDAHGPSVGGGLLDEMLQVSGAEGLLVGGRGIAATEAGRNETR